MACLTVAPTRGLPCNPNPKNESLTLLSAQDKREADVSQAMAAISEAVAEYNMRRL